MHSIFTRPVVASDLIKVQCVLGTIKIAKAARSICLSIQIL